MTARRHTPELILAAALWLVYLVAVLLVDYCEASWNEQDVWRFTCDVPLVDHYRCYVAQYPQGPWFESADLPRVTSEGKECYFEHCGNKPWVRYILLTTIDPETGVPTDPRLR